MANDSGQGYLFGVLQRGAQQFARAPSGGLTRAAGYAPPPVGVAGHTKPGAQAQPVRLEVDEEVAASEEAHGRATPSREQLAGDPSHAEHHTAEPAHAEPALAEPAQLFSDSVAGMPSEAHTTRLVETSEVMPAAGGEPAGEVDVSAQAQSAPAASTQAARRTSESDTSAAVDSEGVNRAGHDAVERRPQQAGWRADESFTFDARRQRQATAEGATDPHMTSVARTRTNAGRDVRAPVSAAPEPSTTPTIRVPRHPERTEPESQATPARRAHAHAAGEAAASPPSPTAEAVERPGDAPARGEIKTVAVARDSIIERAPMQQSHADETVVPEWARELARGLGASVTPPPPNPASVQLAPALPRRPPTQPRDEAPRLTIHRLDVQVINQPPAPAVQYISLPATEAEPPLAAADLDRYYLGRFNF